MSETEQNKTEEPTPFKLKRAREKGNVAKGMDMAFFATLMGLGLYVVILGPKIIHSLIEMMRITFKTLILDVENPYQATLAISMVYRPAVLAVLLLGAITFTTVFFVQMFQTRGLLFTTHPLKPDFNRINPGKGLKRIISVKTLKEAVKNILKISVYLACTYFLVIYSLNQFASTIVDAPSLIRAMHGSALRLLFLYMALALVFTALDQVIVRREFMKQMRMSKSELQRENKDREGEPRMKQKRKQLHAEFVEQTQSLGDLPGSDLLIVNPHHYAVGVAYDAKTKSAPHVTTKGRNRFALELKRKAFLLGIPVIESPELARTLFRTTNSGQEIPASTYQNIADLYLRLYRSKTKEDQL